jgi:predicted  nucleic acid-binding Zn-ribbon protein
MWQFITLIFTRITDSFTSDLKLLTDQIKELTMANKAQFDELFARQDAAEVKHAEANTANIAKLDELKAEIAALKEQIATLGMSAAEEDELLAKLEKNVADYEALLATVTPPVEPPVDPPSGDPEPPGPPPPVE